MKYCKKCNMIFSSDKEICDCNKELFDIEDNNTPTYLITANGFEKGVIEGKLKDMNVPYVLKPEKNESGASILIGNANENARILVPFSAYLKCREELIGMGLLDEEKYPLDKTLEDEINTFFKKDNDTDAKEKPQEINRWATITVMIIVLLILAVSIWCVDAIIAWVQGLFS